MAQEQTGIAAVDDIPDVTDYRALATSAARAAGIDPDLVQRLIEHESSWNPSAVSPKGAVGLMQLMPDTAKALGVTDPHDPVQNLRAGTAYLATLLDQFGDTRKAVAAYNAGPDAVARYGDVPPFKETQDYVNKIVGQGIASVSDIPPDGIAKAEPIPGLRPPVAPAVAFPNPASERINGQPTWNALRAMLKIDPQNQMFTTGPPGLIEAIQSGADDTTLDTLAKFYGQQGQSFAFKPGPIPQPLAPGELPGQVPSMGDVARSALHLGQDVLSPATRMGRAAVELGAIQNEAETKGTISGTRTARAANELIEGFFQATTPLIGAAAIDNPIPIAKGLIQAWLASHVGETAAAVVTDSQEAQRLAGNLAALGSGAISARGLLEGAKATDRATFDVQAGVAAILRKAQATARNLAVASKLNLGTPEQATSPASSGYGTGEVPGYRAAPYVDEATARPSEQAPTASALKLEEEIRVEDRARAEEAATRRAETPGETPPRSTTAQPGVAFSEQIPAWEADATKLAEGTTNTEAEIEAARARADQRRQEGFTARVNGEVPRETAPELMTAEDHVANLPDGSKPGRKLVPFPVADNDFADRVIWSADQANPTLKDVPLANVVATQSEVDAKNVLANVQNPNARHAELPSVSDQQAGALPRMVEWQGNYYAGDGTHRLVSEWAQGHESAQAIVYQVKGGALAETPPKGETFLDQQTSPRRRPEPLTSTEGAEAPVVEEEPQPVGAEALTGPLPTKPVKTTKSKSVWAQLSEGHQKALLEGIGPTVGGDAAWQQLAKTGASDQQILDQASTNFGISGGRGGPGDIATWHKGGKNPTLTLDEYGPNKVVLKGSVLAHTLRDALGIPQPGEAPPDEGLSDTDWYYTEIAKGTPDITKDAQKGWFDEIPSVQWLERQSDDNLYRLLDAMAGADELPARVQKFGKLLIRMLMESAGQQQLPGILKVEDIPEGESNEGGQRPVAGGRPTGAGVSAQPVGGGGTTSPEGVAGEQPETQEEVPQQPAQQKPARTRGARSRRKPASAGAAPEGGGEQPGTGAGVDEAGHVDTADVAEDLDEADAHARGEAPRWFSITGASSLTEGSWTQKLDDNLAALKLLKALQAEGRPASDEEQQVLARYIGWGHTELAPIVDLRGDYGLSDPRKKLARQTLEEVLTKDELRELGESIANAHYSFFELPRAMWALAQRLGFKGGSVLEPAVGSGHFLGTMPGELLAQRRTKVHAVDKEPIAAGIARQLYQGAYIQTSPLEEAIVPDNYFDLHISNVPFGKIGIFDARMAGPQYAAVTKSIHNYYFAKALETARPGGLILYITSRHTLDSQSDAVRQYIEKRARFVGAIRLSSQAFKKTAGTEVVTDIIVLQKHGPGVAKTDVSWLKSVDREDLGKKWERYENRETIVHTNEYFVQHPEMVLGTEDRSGKMNKSDVEYNVVGPVTAETLQAAVNRFPEGILKPVKAAPRKIAKNVDKDTRQGSFVLENGTLYTFDRGTLTPTTLKGTSLARAKSFVPLRDAYLTVIERMLHHAEDADLEAARTALQQAYDGYVATHGHLNTRENKRIIDADPNASRILALENIDILKGEKGKPSQIIVTGTADIFKPGKRLMNPPHEPTAAANPTDALVHSIAWKGRVDLEYMSGLTGQPPAELTAALKDEIFQDVATKAWVARDEYLSGDVVTKLAQAEAAAKADKAFAGNAIALRAVQPTPITIDDFSGDPETARSAPFGATWVPVPVVERFLNANGGHVDLRLVNSKTLVQWYVDGYGGSEFLPPGANYAEWVQQSLMGELPTIKTKDPVTKSDVTDLAATERYRQSLAQLREQWSSWWKGDPDTADQLVNIYNAMFNREVARTFDGSRLVTPNSNPEIVLRAGQKDSIVGALQRGNTLLAQAVGWGKTYEAIAIAGEWKRLGLANKPMIVVPNHITEQWRRDILTFYPAARVLIPEKRDFETGNRKRLVARIANNDWDMVVLGMSQFLRVAAKLESVRAFIQEQEDQLLQQGAEELGISVEEFSTAVERYGSSDADERKAGAKVISGRGKPRTAKDIARSILNLRKRLRKRTDQQAKDPINFEDLGVDGLIVDEAHDYKNLYFFSKKSEIVGLRGSDSDRAMDMYLKVRHVNLTSNNRNVIFATGTPITNTMSELYTVFRYLAQDSLDRLGMGGFDAWANAYAEAVGSMEPAPEGGYKERNRLSQWNNLGELSRLFKRFADVITTEDILKENARLEALGEQPLLKLPKVKKITLQLDQHPQFETFMQDLKGRIELIKDGEPRQIGWNTKENRPIFDNFLTVTTSAGLAAVDMRLVMPGAANDPHGRIPTAAREIFKRYQSAQPTLGTQIVFLDSGVPTKAQIPPLPNEFADPTLAPAEEGDDDTPDQEDTEDIVDEEAEAEKEMDGINSVGLQGRDLYGELRRQLVAKGVKDHEIAYIHQATNPSEKRRLFDAMNSGKIRVLIASRFKGGTGMNVQKKIVALHHIDVPWRPDQLEQAEGRAVRQGNENDTVEILRYVTKKSFDEYRWYILAKKQGFISGFYRGDLASGEDIDTTQLDMQTAAALASGDPRVMQMLQLERAVRGLSARYENFQRRRTTAERDVKRATEQNKEHEEGLTAIKPVQAELKAWGENPTVTVTATLDRYGSIGRGSARTFKLHDTDERKALKEAFAPLLDNTDAYYNDNRQVAEAGPFVIRRNVVTHEQGTEMDDKGNVMVIPGHNATVLTVALPLPNGQEHIVGSTPEWDEDHKPDIIRSLDYKLDPNYADETTARLKKYIAANNTSVTESKRVLDKTFDQKDELDAKLKELHDLRVALGIEKAQSAAEKKGPEEEATDEMRAPSEARNEMKVPEPITAGFQAAGKTLTDARSELRATLTAPEVNQPARLSARMLRRRVAQMTHTIEYARHALATFRNAVEALTVDHDAILNLADMIENPKPGQVMPTLTSLGKAVSLEPWVKTRDQIFTRLKKQLQDLGIERQWRDHYLGHVWETQFKGEPGKVKAALSRIIGRRPLRGPMSFLKQRTIPTMRKGVEQGLVPRTWNLVEIDLYKMEEMAKFIMAHQFLKDLKDNGLATFHTALRRHPKDLVALPDPMGEMWAPPQITVAEAYDKLLMEGLENYVRSLGVKYSRKPMSGKTWGYTGADTGNVTMRFGSPEFALMHETGHALDALYGLRERLWEGVKKNQFEDEKWREVRAELSKLGEMRYQGMQVDEDFKRYVQKPTELVANLVHAYLHAPHVAKKIAPHWYDAFDDLVTSMPELEFLGDLQQMRSLVMGVRETEQPLPGPILLGRYYVDPAVARIVKNYLTPGLSANKLWALVRVPANALVQAKLSFSAFHSFVITQESAALKAKDGITDVLRGRVSGLKLIGQAAIEPGMVIRRGTKAQREYLNTMDPMSLAVDSATNLLLAGGGRVRQSSEFNNRSVRKFMDHLRRANAQFIRKQHGKAGAELLGAAVRSLPALVEAATWPILQWLVPVAKAGAAESTIRAELARYEGTPTDQTLLAIAGKAVNLTDATLGEVIWDNYFLPRALMSAVHMVIMAPGWRGGSAVILARGLTDPIRRLFPGQREDYQFEVPIAAGGGNGKGPEPEVPEGDKPLVATKIVTHKERYWSPYTSLMIATVMVQVLVSEIFQLAHGAGHVQTIRDVAFPRDGQKDANGKPTRVRLPGYTGIFFDILRDMPKSMFDYVLGGTAPMPTALGQLYHNETIFGDEIVDSTDPWRQQLWDYAKFLKDQAMPISVTSYGRRTGSTAEKFESVLGISPAPARVTRTPLEEYLHDLQPPAHRTKDQAEKAQARRDFKTATREGDRAAAATAAQEGGLSLRSVEAITRNLRYRGPQQAFQATTLPQAVRAYELASPEERGLIKPLLQRKVATQMINIPVDQRAEMLKRVRAALQLPTAQAQPAAAGAGRR